MLTHGWELSHHMCICGLNHDGSSNVPAFSHSTSGVATTSLTMAEPHLGQNLRKTGSPLSPTSGSADSGTLRSEWVPPRSRSGRYRTSNLRRCQTCALLLPRFPRRLYPFHPSPWCHRLVPDASTEALFT